MPGANNNGNWFLKTAVPMRLKRAATLIAILCFAAALLVAQSFQGGVRGSVEDAQGAAIAKAAVTLTNDGTGEARTTMTNGEGGFEFTQLIPATYTLVAESPNFKKFERKNIIVGTQEFVIVDVRLAVGSVSESVLVEAEVPLIESANASQGQVLDNQKLSDLPNLGRNPFMMAKLSTNIVQVGPPAYNRMEDQSGSSMISLAGGPVRGNNYLLDGIPITDANNRAIIVPSLETVQEVKIQVNTYDAEMARTGGGMFNTLMKSGGNDYHGSLYGHVRRTDWDANAFFSNAAGIPITDQPNTTWGASFGGPVSIPKVYNGKNRTFFFLAVEHYDDASSDSADFNLPTVAERTGDFSKSFDANGQLHVIYDPLTGAPFPGNIIPASRITNVGQNIANTYPLPTSAPAYYGDSDIALASSIKARAVQYTAKLDEDFTARWRMSLSYARYYSLEPGDTWFNSPSTESGWRLLRRVDATAINSIFTISPTMVLTLRYGFNRFPNFDYNSSQGYNIGRLGFNQAYANSILPSVAEFPAINMSSLYSLGDTGDWDYYDEASHNFSVAVDKFVSRHSIRAGFDYRHLATSGAGINCTTGCYTFNTDSSLAASNSGTDLADLLLGLPYNRQADTSSTLTDVIPYYGAFVQDNIRVTSKLTVNAGLRWEHEGGVREQNNGLITGFNETATSPIASQVPSLDLKGAVEYAGVNGAPDSVGNYEANKWGPRAGIAWQLDSKTVVRGGYGMYWAPQIALGGPLATLGYANNTQYTGKSTTDVLTNPFPNGLLQPVGNTLGAAAGIGSNFTLVDPQTKAPRVQQYSVDVQREVGFGVALEVGYVGSHSTHLTLGQPTINVDALNPSYLSQGSAALDAQVPNPFAGVPAVAGGTLSGPTVSAFQLLLPFPAYTGIYQIFGDNNHASYNSMVVKAQKRFSHGLTFLSAFTWSKNMDESSGGVGTSLNPGAQGYPQNPYNMAAEYSLSNVDTPLRWTTSLSYQLPIGKGKELWNIQNRGLDLIAGGWVLNTVTVYQTGFPLQIYQTNLNSAYGYGAQRPDMTSVAPGTSGSVEQRIYDYINPAAFSLAPQGTFGNTPRTIGLRGPGEKNWDMSVFKNFAIKERVNAQFRCEALNAFNSPYFYSPNTNFSSGTFGQITGQANFSRQLQLAIRVTY
ncbi:MAG: TonB-dependent receptor [Bryobacteraceae bacterium]